MAFLADGDVSNSRMSFGAAFEVVYNMAGDQALVENANGKYAFVSTEYPDVTPVLFSHGREEKVYRKAPAPMQHENRI